MKTQPEGAMRLGKLLAIRGIASRRGAEATYFRWTCIREWGTRYASGYTGESRY